MPLLNIIWHWIRITERESENKWTQGARYYTDTNKLLFSAARTSESYNAGCFVLWTLGVATVSNYACGPFTAGNAQAGNSDTFIRGWAQSQITDPERTMSNQRGHQITDKMLRGRARDWFNTSDRGFYPQLWQWQRKRSQRAVKSGTFISETRWNYLYEHCFLEI